MISLPRLLARGYFPLELPPQFSTQRYSLIVCDGHLKGRLPNRFTGNAPEAKLVEFSLAKAGNMRRKMGIPNPINYYRLCSLLTSAWPNLAPKLKSSRSSSSPIFSQRGARAVLFRCDFDEIPRLRARVRARGKYILKADVAQFYHSIYTHALSWAWHGKTFAKHNKRARNLTGNNLDYEIRRMQDGQTKGIPIGPDTSLLIAELLLARIDEELQKALGREWFRHVDDFEFATPDVATAEKCLSLLQRQLQTYELALNSQKVKILSLPCALEQAWAIELRKFKIRDTPKGQQQDLIDFFSCGFALSKEYPDNTVLKYAVQRLRSIEICEENWALYQDLLGQCMVAEPGCLDAVIGELARRKSNGLIPSRRKLRGIFERIILYHAPLAHGSEVAWCLSGAIFFGVTLSKRAAKRISAMSDSVVALVAIHATQNRLLPRVSTRHWESFFTADALWSENWLLIYESLAKGWFRTAVRARVNVDAEFRYLLRHGVEFYSLKRKTVSTHSRSMRKVTYS